MATANYRAISPEMVSGIISPTWIWITPPSMQGQTVETQFSRGIPGGLSINYDADYGERWMRVKDHSIHPDKPGHVEYFRLIEEDA